MTPESTAEHVKEQAEETVRTPQGAWVWFAAFGAIVAWMAHLIAEASFTRFTCTESGTEWVLHALTVLTAGVAALATALSWRLVRAGGDEDEGAATPRGTSRFLGLFGVITGITNLLLIVLEGSYVFFIPPCA